MFRVGNVDLIKTFFNDFSLTRYEGLPELNAIISNPPYLLRSDEIADDVRTHEPDEALFAPDEDPLFFYKFIFEVAEKKMTSGFIALEIAEQRADEICTLAKTFNFMDCKISNDLAGRPRYALLTK